VASIQVTKWYQVERMNDVTSCRAAQQFMGPRGDCGKVNHSSRSQPNDRAADAQPSFLIRIFNFVFQDDECADFRNKYGPQDADVKYPARQQVACLMRSQNEAKCGS